MRVPRSGLLTGTLLSFGITSRSSCSRRFPIARLTFRGDKRDTVVRLLHLILLTDLVYVHFDVAQRDWQGVSSITHRRGANTVEYWAATTLTIVRMEKKETDSYRTCCGTQRPQTLLECDGFGSQRLILRLQRGSKTSALQKFAQD